MDMKIRRYVKVYGRVQGVFFRANTKTVADKHGVKGYVKNLPDGTVEAVLEGEEEAVKKVIEWMHTGPPLAKVKKLEVREEEYKGEYRDFRIEY